MQKNDGYQILKELKKFKDERGNIDMKAVLEIPRSNRIQEMVAVNEKEVYAVLTIAITRLVDSINILRKPTGDQILDIVDSIVETSAEDQLSIEDVMLFIQKLGRGEYGQLYESLDSIKFFDLFENYREERYQAFRNHKEAKESYYKGLGDGNRSSDERRVESIDWATETKLRNELKSKNEKVKK